MKIKLLLTLLCLVGASAQATVIPLDLGPPRLISGAGRPDWILAQMIVTSNALNGSTPSGQTLSLDYQFNHYLKVLNTTHDAFFVAIRAQINVPEGFHELDSVSSTGYFVRADGSSGPATTSSGGGIFGPESEILFGFAWSDVSWDTPYPHPSYVYSGLHFDMTLPELEGVEITGLTVRFGESFNHFAFAITDTVPESGSTLG
jgi:hypothetical protein